ncbi:MAG: zinc-ribbon domain-containing protein [Candidatus Hodarchaeota archaeon]
MPKYCVYCGNPLKPNDKYCIICGKPVLSDVQKPKPKEAQKPKDIIKEKVREIKGEPTEVEIEEEPLEEIEIKKEKKIKHKDLKLEKPLPFEVKEQMILYIEYNDIQLNKKLLIEKLKEIQKSLNDPRYDVEEEFKKSINIKTDAIKTLINELKQKENEVQQKMAQPFIVQRIKDDINKRVFQLKNLTQEFKLRKIDKDTFEQLREKYKEERAEFEKEREDLISGMKLWIKELKMEKSELKAERNLNKGRYSAKEINEQDYKEKEKQFDLKLKKIDVKIDTLEKLIE